MILFDTSVVVDALRDKSGDTARRIAGLVAADDFFITRFTELELLQGANSEGEWADLSAYVAKQDVIEPNASIWSGGARIYFDLRRQGATLRGIVDCCIAQTALERDLLLLHNDRDFDAIASIRPLKHRRVNA